MQHSAQRRHISAQRIIILSFENWSHMLAHIVHISAHIPHMRGDMVEKRIMHRIAIWHMSAQS